MSRTHLAFLLAVVGCGGTTRSSTAYRDATKQLFDGKDPEIKACYDRVLAGSPAAVGTVTVTFAFEPDTGKLVGAKLDPVGTTAPEAVSQCVLSSIGSLAINPGDKHRGEATWSWSFTAPRASS